MKATDEKGYGCGSGTETVYAVEARTTYTEPQTHGGMVLTHTWRRVSFREGFDCGIPNGAFCAYAQTLRLYSYEAATALAAWFRAAEGWRGGLCVETRLVRINLSYTYSTKETGVGPAVGTRPTELFTDRPAPAEKE